MDTPFSKSCGTKTQRICNLDDLVNVLTNTFAEDIVDIDNVKSILSSYKSNYEDWKKYAHFDTHRYTRNLVAGNARYNLIALCWGEGHGSSIHAHENAHCFVKMLDGQMRETRYAWPTGSQPDCHMTCTGVATCCKDDVTYIHDSQALHRMENPSHSNSAVSLHLYVPPYQMTDSFDERTGHKTTIKMRFWSERGKMIKFKLGDEEPFEPENN